MNKYEFCASGWKSTKVILWCMVNLIIKIPLPCYCGLRDLPCNSSILPKSVAHFCCLHVRLSCAVLTGAIISMDERSTNFEISVPLVLWYAALSWHHRTYSAHKTEMHYRLLHCTKFPTSMPLHGNHTMNSICLTDWLTRHQLYVIQTAIVASYRKIKCGVNRNLNIDHISTFLSSHWMPYEQPFKWENTVK